MTSKTKPGVRAERRRRPRRRLNGWMHILWEDANGRERISRAQCVDVSSSGIRLRALERIPDRTSVMFNCPALSVAGRGTTRYCRLKKAAYEIGVECASGMLEAEQVAEKRISTAP